MMKILSNKAVCFVMLRNEASDIDSSFVGMTNGLPFQYPAPDVKNLIGVFHQYQENRKNEAGIKNYQHFVGLLFPDSQVPAIIPGKNRKQKIKSQVFSQLNEISLMGIQQFEMEIYFPCHSSDPCQYDGYSQQLHGIVFNSYSMMASSPYN